MLANGETRDSKGHGSNMGGLTQWTKKRYWIGPVLRLPASLQHGASCCSHCMEEGSQGPQHCPQASSVMWTMKHPHWGNGGSYPPDPCLVLDHLDSGQQQYIWDESPWWCFRNQNPWTRSMTPCNEYIHVKLLGKENILCDTAVCNTTLMNKYSIERWERWRNGEWNSRYTVKRSGTRKVTVVTGVGESCYGQGMGHIVTGKVVSSSMEFSQAHSLCPATQLC